MIGLTNWKTNEREMRLQTSARGSYRPSNLAHLAKEFELYFQN